MSFGGDKGNSANIPWWAKEQTIFDKARGSIKSRHHPSENSTGHLELLRASPTPHLGGVMDNNGKDFWLTGSNSMVIVICIGSVAILIGIVALVWKYVIKDGSTRERCRLRKRFRKKSTPDKTLYKHNHALGVYTSVLTDNSTTEFHYEHEGGETNKAMKPDCQYLDVDHLGHDPASQETFAIRNSTPNSGKYETKKGFAYPETLERFCSRHF